MFFTFCPVYFVYLSLPKSITMPFKEDISILDAISKRYSPMGFLDTPLPEDTLMHLFEAARWAPSSFNQQPWHFIYALKSEPEAFEQILDTLTEYNREWAHTASLLIVTVAQMFFDHNKKPNRHAYYDAGMAVGNFLAQATSMGLYAHQMGGFSSKKAITNLHIPNGYEPVAVMAVGYPEDISNIPEKFKKRATSPRIRRPLDSFVFKGKWKQH